MKRCFASLIVLMLSGPLARAHFIWIVPDVERGTARVVFSDTPQPDQPELLTKIAKTGIYLRKLDGKTAPLKWELGKGENSYRVQVPTKEDCLLGGVCAYGVVQRGKQEPFLLKYHAKAYVGWPAEASGQPMPLNERWDRLDLEIRSHKPRGSFHVAWRGEKVVNAPVVILAPNQEKAEETKTDQNGDFAVRFPRAGLYGVRVLHTEKQAGELDWKKYKEIRNYATLVFRVGEKDIDKP